MSYSTISKIPAFSIASKKLALASILRVYILALNSSWSAPELNIRFPIRESSIAEFKWSIISYCSFCRILSNAS